VFRFSIIESRVHYTTAATDTLAGREEAGLHRAGLRIFGAVTKTGTPRHRTFAKTSSNTFSILFDINGVIFFCLGYGCFCPRLFGGRDPVFQSTSTFVSPAKYLRFSTS
jgi:hypothetical protein